MITLVCVPNVPGLVSGPQTGKKQASLRDKPINVTLITMLLVGQDLHSSSAIFQNVQYFKTMDNSLSENWCPRSKQVNQQSRHNTNQEPIYYGVEVAGQSLKANVSIPSQGATGLVQKHCDVKNLRVELNQQSKRQSSENLKKILGVNASRSCGSELFAVNGPALRMYSTRHMVALSVSSERRRRDNTTIIAFFQDKKLTSVSHAPPKKMLMG